MPALCRLLLASGRQQAFPPAAVVATVLALGLALASPTFGQVRPIRRRSTARHRRSSSTTPSARCATADTPTRSRSPPISRLTRKSHRPRPRACRDRAVRRGDGRVPADRAARSIGRGGVRARTASPDSRAHRRGDARCSSGSSRRRAAAMSAKRSAARRARRSSSRATSRPTRCSAMPPRSSATIRSCRSRGASCFSRSRIARRRCDRSGPRCKAIAATPPPMPVSPAPSPTRMLRSPRSWRGGRLA